MKEKQLDREVSFGLRQDIMTIGQEETHNTGHKKSKSMRGIQSAMLMLLFSILV